jgi:hypothetical protein
VIQCSLQIWFKMNISLVQNNFYFNKYSKTSICHPWIIRFPGSSVVQFLCSLCKSYFNYGSHIYCFPGYIVSFSDPRRKWWIEVSLYLSMASDMWTILGSFLFYFWTTLHLGFYLFTGQSSCFAWRWAFL